MNGTDEPEEPPTYAVRVTERAQRDIDAATVHFAEAVSPAIAVAWREGFYERIASLATFPRACPLISEKFQGEVRQLLYRRSESKTAYRVLFSITGEQAGAEDAPTVTILHVRHAAARPITRKEARQIESEQ